MTRRSTTSIQNPVIIPRPTDSYDSGYMNNLVKAIQGAFDYLNKPSMLRGGEIFLENIASTGAGLPEGAVFSDGGLLRIVRAGDVFVSSFGVAASLGSVTVTT